MATCKRCGAPIVFIKTPKGKWMPCNEGLVEYKAGSSPDYDDVVVNDKGEVIKCTFDFRCPYQRGGRVMTTVEKRKLLEAVDICVRGDLLSDMEFDQIMQICYVAVGRAFREAEEGET